METIAPITVIELKPPPPRKIEICTTQHFPDFEQMNASQMKDVCTRVKEVGINSLRWNFRWAKIMTENGVFNHQAYNHYVEAMKSMKETGLESILVLSDPPEYIKNIARTTGNSEEFQTAFKRYLGLVQKAHEEADVYQIVNGEKIYGPKVIQFENELNVGMYNDWIKVGGMNDKSKFSVPEIRQALQMIKEYFPHSDRLMNMFFSNAINIIAKGIAVGNRFPPVFRGLSGKDYLELLSQCKDDFEILGIDYYPGTYNFTKLGQGFPAMWSDLKPIEDILTKASDKRDEFLGKKKIALTEFGAVSGLGLLPFTPKTQKGFYVYFLRELQRIVRKVDTQVAEDSLRFRQPLTMISTYQIHDENDPHTAIQNFGVLDIEGNPKSYGAKRTSADTVKSIFKLLNRTNT